MDTGNSAVIRSCRRGAVSLAVFLFSLFLGTQLAHADSWEEVQPEGDVPDACYGQSMVEIDGEAHIFGGADASGVGLNHIWALNKDTSDWEKIVPENDAPPGRHFHTAVAYDGKMYVVSGVGQDGKPFLCVWVYDRQAKTWEQLPPGDTNRVPRYNHPAAVIGDSMIIFGGTDVNGNPLADTWIMNFSTGNWEQVQPPADAPDARSGHTMVQMDGKAYAYGGEDPSGLPLNELWEFEPDNSDWLKIGPENDPPPGRHSHAAVENSGKMYASYGMGKDGEVLSDVWVYDRQANTWQELAQGEVRPPARYNHSAVVVGNCMIVYGGRDENGNALGDIWSLNLSTGNWEKLQPSGVTPDARYGHSMVKIDDNAYVFGGARGSGVELNDLWKFDRGANKWEKGGPDNPPPERKFHTAVAYDGNMIIFFGVGKDGKVLSDVWAYDPTANTWQELAQGYLWWAARWGHTAVVVSDHAIIFGGMSERGYAKGDTWSLDLSTDEWEMKNSCDGLPRYGHGAVATDGRMCVVGGYTYSPGKDLWSYSNETWFYGTVWDNWLYVYLVGDPPPPRAFHATAFLGSAAVGGRKPIVAVIAGMRESSGNDRGRARPAQDTEIDLDDTWEFDLTDKTWTQRADLPMALSHSAAVAFETDTGQTEILLFGGLSNGQPVGKMWCYSPEGKPAITEVKATDTGELQLTWPSRPDETYTVWSRLDLVTGDWVQEETLQSEGDSTSYTLTVPPARAKYYRIEIPPR